MISSPNALATLKQRQPEWSPWLHVVESVLDETADPAWDAMVPAGVHCSSQTVPLLAHTTIPLDTAMVRRSFDRLVRIASTSGAAKMASLDRVIVGELDMPALFGASVCHDSGPVHQIAVRSNTDADALHAVVTLLSVPFLQACHRQWSMSVPESWTEGYCPVCASWPAFVESRGIERRRYARCGRCGAAWHAQLLRCAYCGTSNHGDLVTLVPRRDAARGSIEACTRCRCYTKTFTTLQGCPPGWVIIEDLSSVDLDVAALGDGYTHPQGAGYALAVSLADRGTAQRQRAGTA